MFGSVVIYHKKREKIFLPVFNSISWHSFCYMSECGYRIWRNTALIGTNRSLPGTGIARKGTHFDKCSWVLSRPTLLFTKGDGSICNNWNKLIYYFIPFIKHFYAFN